jgi:hypothetical protein
VPEQLAEIASDVTAEVNGNASSTTNGHAPKSPDASRAGVVRLTPASEIRPERVRWLWKGRIALRSLAVIAGEPGLGKSLLTNALLPALVTRGRLEGELHGHPRDVLVASAEDDWGSVVVPRLMAQGADLERVFRLDMEHAAETLTLPDHVSQLAGAVHEHRRAGRPIALVVLDPIGAFLSAATDTHKDAQVRRALAPLAQLAIDADLVVAVVAHLTKDGSQRLLQRVSGAGAFGAAPRSVLGFARDPNDPRGEQGLERVIVHAKSNWGRYAPTLAARVESRDVEIGCDDTTEQGYLLITGESSVGLEDLQLTAERDDSEAVEEAIAAALADGPRPSREVKAVVKDEQGCSVATIKRAAARMQDRGELEITEGGFPRTTTWELLAPVGSPQSAHPPDTSGEPTVETPMDTGDSTCSEPSGLSGLNPPARAHGNGHALPIEGGPLDGWEPYRPPSADPDDETDDWRQR